MTKNLRPATVRTQWVIAELPLAERKIKMNHQAHQEKTKDCTMKNHMKEPPPWEHSTQKGIERQQGMKKKLLQEEDVDDYAIDDTDTGMMSLLEHPSRIR